MEASAYLAIVIRPPRYRAVRPMSRRTTLPLGIVLLVFAGVLITTLLRPSASEPNEGPTGAFHALQLFAQQRTYPSEVLPRRGYAEAFTAAQTLAKHQQDDDTRWTTLGPYNLAGRMLTVALNPQNPRTIWAGSASGGLWQSSTGGVGPRAWTRVATGHPVLGVASVAISPADTNVVYIGTGEVYNRPNTQGGWAVRETRGSYGIGILKTTDGGESWTPSLDWSREQQRGVQMIRIDPQDAATVWAATTEGVYVSRDAGATWARSLDVVMATDVQVHPGDSDRLLAACGNLGSPGRGIYRSTDGGASWTRITQGLPPTEQVFGKTLLDVAPSAPEVVYASIGRGSGSGVGPGAVGGRGNWLARSEDFGQTWRVVSTDDYASLQGWYSHFVAVHPTTADRLLAAGVVMLHSETGGQVTEVTAPSAGRFDEPAIGGPEGEPGYIHVDMHGFARHPSEPNTVYIATDGGLFRTEDFGVTFDALNGGLQTAQFYPGTAHSQADSLHTFGGLQDNGVALYRGGQRWRLVFGGDGNYTAIDPRGNGLVYGSYQYLSLLRSFDGGFTWNFEQFIDPPTSGDNVTLETAFIAPFVLAPSSPDVLYAGRTRVYHSPDRGETWTATNNGQPLDGNVVLALAVSPSDADVVYATTAPVSTRAGVFRTLDGGQTWTDVTGSLPDRYPTDLAIDPRDDATAYVVFSGFGTSHVFRTTDYGITWQDVGAGLPDMPTSAVAIDADYTGNVFVGTDLGVFFSRDDGQTWEAFNAGLPEAVIVTDLGISDANGTLRVATHGNGMYERTLLEGRVVSTEATPPSRAATLQAPYPNPFRDQVALPFTLPRQGPVRMTVFDLRGRAVARLVDASLPAGAHTATFDARGLASGTYIVRLQTGGLQATRSLTCIR